MNPQQCCVLVPYGGSIDKGCEKSLLELESRGYPVRRVSGYSQIDIARNEISGAALRDGFEELMWIDSDIEFRPGDVDKLRGHNLPICCGIYPKKDQCELACHVLPGTTSLNFGSTGGLTEILYAGTGFLFVKKEVFNRMDEQLSLPICNAFAGRPHRPYFQPLIVNNPVKGPWYLGEDYAFCERARQCGFQIMADTTIRLGHVGQYSYSWEDAGGKMTRFDSFRLNFKDASS